MCGVESLQAIYSIALPVSHVHWRFTPLLEQRRDTLTRSIGAYNWRVRTYVESPDPFFQFAIHSFEGNKNPNIFPFTSHFTFEFLLSSRTQRRRMIKMIVSSLQRLVPFDAIINYLERKIATSYRSSTVPIRFKRQLGNPSASTTLTEKSIYLQSRRIDKRIYP